MGAYQDVLGDLHNLFGEVNEVLVTVDEQGKAHIEDIRPGESCERVLEYMDYDRTGMLDAIARQLRRVAGRSLKKEESRAIYREFEEVFPRYTYLER
jgi:arginine decarboxylase